MTMVGFGVLLFLLLAIKIGSPIYLFGVIGFVAACTAVFGLLTALQHEPHRGA